MFFNYRHWKKFKNGEDIDLKDWMSEYCELFIIMHADKDKNLKKEEYLKLKCISGCKLTYTKSF